MVGAHQMVGGRLAGRIGRVGRVGERLGEGRRIGLERAEHLVGRHVVEAVIYRARAVQPDLARRLQQAVRAHHVGGDERIGTVDRTVDMALGGEVHDRVDGLLAQQPGDAGRIGDVGVHERNVSAPSSARRLARLPA